MKNRLTKLSTLAVLMALAFAQADAQTTVGTVNVHGFVAPRCGATFNGDPTFNGTISLGELGQTNGTLSPTFSSSTAAAPAGAVSFQIGCTGGAANVQLSAKRFSNPVPPELLSSSNDIDFTAQTKFALALGGFATLTYTTAASLPAPSTQLINAYFANTPSNLEVSVYAFSAENGSASILVPGNYDAAITITIAPPA